MLDQKNIFYSDLASYDRDDDERQAFRHAFFEDDEIYAEAKRQIVECGEKKSKKLDLFAIVRWNILSL